MNLPIFWAIDLLHRLVASEIKQTYFSLIICGEKLQWIFLVDFDLRNIALSSLKIDPLLLVLVSDVKETHLSCCKSSQQRAWALFMVNCGHLKRLEIKVINWVQLRDINKLNTVLLCGQNDAAFIPGYDIFNGHHAKLCSSFYPLNFWEIVIHFYSEQFPFRISKENLIWKRHGQDAEDVLGLQLNMSQIKDLEGMIKSVAKNTSKMVSNQANIFFWILNEFWAQNFQRLLIEIMA